MPGGPTQSVKRRAPHDKVAPAAVRASHDALALDRPASWSTSRSTRSDHEELAPEARQDVVAGPGHQHGLAHGGRRVAVHPTRLRHVEYHPRP